MKSSVDTLVSKPFIGHGRAHLVLGECVQGRLSDGLDFLITAPISLSSAAHFTVDREQTLTVRPTSCYKSLRAVRQWLDEQDLPCAGLLEVSTPLPARHGFGTSTADITASLRAAAMAWGRSVTPEEISRIAIGIEPTDGSMYPESVAYAHRAGRLLERLGPLPPFTALALCHGEGVETLEFEMWRVAENGPNYSAQEIRLLGEAWQMVRKAIQTYDVSLLGQACLISAQINERILPKPFYQPMCELVRGGLGEGLITAHSGSAIALLLNPGRPDFEQQHRQACECLKSFSQNGWLELSSLSSIAPQPGTQALPEY